MQYTGLLPAETAFPALAICPPPRLPEGPPLITKRANRVINCDCISRTLRKSSLRTGYFPKDEQECVPTRRRTTCQPSELSQPAFGLRWVDRLIDTHPSDR